MIDNKTYTLDWLDSASKNNRNADRILIEKVIRALTLVHDLSNSNLEFIFKGGTALLLMMDKPSRLSIDIDIIIPKREKDLEALLQKIVLEGTFIRFEEQERKVESNIEKAHFKFYYNPILVTHSREEYILLDVLFENNPYRNLDSRAIQSQFLATTGELVKVQVPSFEDILGDKLTAFAPNTTGIPYFKKETGMGMEILKQLFDIGNLFNLAGSLIEVRTIFTSMAKTELLYRKLTDLSPEDVLDDIFQTSLYISLKGNGGIGNYEEIQKGIGRIKQFIISEFFDIDRVILAASKAAYLSMLLKMNGSQVERFDDSSTIKDLLIENVTYNKLNKLKKVNLEAFFYWFKAVGLLAD